MIDLIYKHIDGLTHDFEAFEGVSILRGEDAIFLVLRDLNKLDDLKSYAMKNGFYDCIDIWINEYKDITIYDYDQVDINYYNYVKSLVVSIYNKKKFNLKKRNNQKIIKLSDYK